MKTIFTLILLISFSCYAVAQKFQLKILGNSDRENKIIDSIGFLLKHQNTKSIVDENNSFYEKLTQKGFPEAQLLESFKPNDSSFTFKYNLGKKVNFIHIHIARELHGNINSSYSIQNDTLVLPYNEIENFLNSVLKKMESIGFSMTKVKLVSIQKSNGYLKADLYISKEIKRNVNDIVINGYTKFPESHKKNIIRLYRNKVFNQRNLDRLYTDFEKFRFVKQSKYPEILFTKDSTKIYVYLEKTKSNTFDGFVGFANDENKKVIFSGYLDLVLNNILNSGEKFALYWKSDGQDQKTFNLGVEVPYIFKSPLGLKAELNIFKQDSTFQNTKTAIDLGYFFNYNTRLYFGYQATESSDIQNANTATLSDFNNSFLTTQLEFKDFKNDDFLFPEKTFFNLKVGTGKRDSKLITDQQLFGNLVIKHNIYINDKNIVTIKSQNFFLRSNNYIVNELQRCGGINSIRGFNENSLQGNLFGSILTEYRYVLSSGLYAHSIIDYGYLQDKTANTNQNLLGLGFGIGLLSKNGLFNIVYANGSVNNQAIKLSNSIIHISYRASF